MAELLDVLQVAAEADMPLAVQLKRQILWLIASGQIKAGDRLPPVRDVANQLGINLHTVRAAYRKLEADGLVTTRQGVGTIVLDLDQYQLARQTAGARTYTIGLIVPDIGNPFYPALLRGVEDAARREAHSLVFVCNTDDDPDKGKAYLDLLIARGVDGIIIAPYGLGPERVSDAPAAGAAQFPIPTVYVDRPGETGHMVLLDSEGAGYAATAHLLEHGHRRIGVITCPLEAPTLRQCFAGHERALQAAGLAFDPALLAVAPVFSLAAGYEAAQRLLDAPTPPSAVFAVGDILALGAMRAMRERGLRIPEDVALVGYNDIEMAGAVEPPLTTVAAPTHELGATAMHMLQQLIAGETVEQPQIVLPTRLIVRQSCGCRPGAK